MTGTNLTYVTSTIDTYDRAPSAHASDQSLTWDNVVHHVWRKLVILDVHVDVHEGVLGRTMLFWWCQVLYFIKLLPALQVVPLASSVDYPFLKKKNHGHGAR